MNQAIELFKKAKEEGRTVKYEKFGNITARLSCPDELVITMIDGIEETRNTAKVGDMVATGQKGEIYIIPAAKFDRLYEKISIPESDTDVYKPKGIVEGVMIPWNSDSFTFDAPWGENMIADPGDYIVTSVSDNFDPEKVYRIEKEAFELTYKKI